ncbi:MAG: xylulokinase [Pseudomonadota bacterium]
MYLGLDLGTSGLRGIVADASGQVHCDAEARLETRNPAPGWSEQDPNTWITACRSVMAELRDKSGPAFADLRAIGISGHMHGATLVDAQGGTLAPCILWNDTRAAQQAAQLDESSDIRASSGNIVFPGFTAPKLVWMQENDPETFERISKVLLPKDFLRFWLTGEFLSEMSDAAGTSWLDVGARAWSDTALAATGMRRDQMPDLIEGADAGGTLRSTLLDEWGLKGPVIVAGGAADNAAAACGVGCLKEGQGFVSLGTSGVLLAGRDRFAPAPETAVHTFCHAVPERWYQMGVILAATDSLNWLALVMGKTAGTLAEALPEEISGPAGATFLPYLSGERTPHNDARIRGAFVGLDISAGPETLTQAVMEGVAFALRDSLVALSATGVDLENVLAVGGGARSMFWMRTLATVLDLPLQRPRGSELGAALGALRLAICADTGGAPEEVMTSPPVADVIEPDATLRSAYEDAYGRYRALYPALSAVT